MKKTTICILLLFSCQANADLLGLSNPAEMAGKKGFAFHAATHYLTGADFTAAQELNGDWGGIYSPRNNNLAILIAKVEAGVTYDSWRLSGIYRKDLLIEANRDMTDLIYYNRQRLVAPAGKTFIADLRIEGFEARGLRIDKGHALVMNDDVDLLLGAGISLLQGTRVRIANADGIITSTATGYSYNATLNDSNSRATYQFIRPASPEGRGYALNLGAKIIWAKGAHLDFTVNDLLAQMTWRNMPNTIETANSAIIARDAAGYTYYNPTISGKNDINRRTIVQRLTPRAHSRLTYPAADFDLFAGTGWMKGYWFPEAGVSWRINDNCKAVLDIETRFKTVGLGIAHKLGRLNARSSSITPSNAQAYGFNAEIYLPF